MIMSVSLLLAFLARSPRLQLLEEVVALVIYEDECWKITVEDFPAFILVDDKGNDFFKQLKPWTPCKECQK